MFDGIFSGPHLIIVAIIFVALFGAAKLPIFARSLGQSMRIFKSEIKGLKDDDEVAPAPGTIVQQQPVVAPVSPAVPQYVQQPVQAPSMAKVDAAPAPAPQIFTDANGQQFVMQPVTPQPEQH